MIRDVYLAELRVPGIFIPLLKLFCKNVNIIHQDVYDLISNMIEVDRFDDAKGMINYAKNKYGVSTFTTRLETRISRTELIGK